ncbi:MAG: Cna B-type domain-containing protein, partial [Oscillospiraceae bacterium]|nr:Cna B-type domain-containing protein [Oscillospiraceae bacterium]
MKNRLWKRLISACLALLLFCSNAELIAYSDASVQAGASGIGVYNRVLTDDSEAPVTYRVRLYQYDAEQDRYTEVSLTQAYDLGVEYMDRDGKIELAKNEGVNFTDSLEFMEFLDRNGVAKITIEPDSAANSVTVLDSNGDPVPRKKYQEYPSGASITYLKKETGWALQGNGAEQEVIAAYTSTKISPLVVERDWRDRGEDRGQQGKGDFTIRVGNAVQSIGDAYFELDDESSNQHYYNYYLPEYNQNGQRIAYTVTSNLADTASYYHVPSQGQTLTADPQGVYHINSIGLTDLEFTVEWLDGAKPEAKGSYDSAAFKTYLTENFTLLDESDAEIHFTEADIEVTETESGQWAVKIRGLVDIAEDNTAKVYSLRPNTDENDSLPLVADDASGDRYLPLAANEGVHSSDTDEVYEGGTLSLLLSGKMDFTGAVEWRDAGANAERLAVAEDPSAAAAKIVVWRYVDTGSATDIASSAQVETILISGEAYRQSFSVEDLDKYDNKGRPYVYYGKENILIRDSSGSDPYEKFYASLDEPQEYLLNGETVYNKLAAKSVYSVDAKWVAAARQGGDAEAVFELQRKDADGNWVPVPGLAQEIDRNGDPVFNADGTPHLVSASTITISDFRAEAMEIKAYFPEVPDYDDDGNLYQYRVVQTALTRRDQNNGEDPITASLPDDFTAGSNETVTIGQDEYIVVGTQPTNPADPYEFDFTYTLVGDIKIVMVKDWRDPEPVDHSGDTVKLQIRYLPFGAQNDVVYSPDPENYPNYVYQLPVQDSWTTLDTVPRYDAEGHELEYYVNEIEAIRPGYYSVYELVKGTDENGHPMYTYTIQNIPTGEHEPRYIGIRKEWIDDGELEFRQPITIRAQGDSPTGGSGTGGEGGTGGQQEAGSLMGFEQPEDPKAPAPDETGEEEAAPPAYFGDLDDGDDTAASAVPSASAAPQPVQALERSGAQLHADEPDEDPAPAVHDGVWLDDQAKEVSESTAWQTFFKAHSDYVYSDSKLFTEHMSDASTGDYWNIDDITAAATGSNLDSEAQWIYKLLSSGYYTESETNAVHAVQEENFVRFPGLVGVYKNNQHYYAVQQIWHDNSTMNGMDGEVVFRNTRIGVVSYKIHFDWKIGNDLDQVTSVTVKITGNGDVAKEYTILVKTVLEDYYILNLPKYDENGKIIEYQIEELYLNGQAVTDGACTFNGKPCVVRLTQDPTRYGEDAHTDDLMQITLTNQYEDQTSFTAHKAWHDNSNRYYSRSDLYIKLYRKSSAPGAAEEALGNEYLWIRSPEDTVNAWTYHFESLDKFDAGGYPYTYYIREAPLEKYRTVYDNAACADATLQSVTDAACDGGTIHNYLYDEVVIYGKKLWQNVSSKLTAENYPIATVRLYVGKRVSGAYVPDKLIAECDILNGQTNFRFRYNADPTVYPNNRLIDDSYVVRNEDGTVKTNGSGNIILPKYNEEGVLIKYVLDEKSIHGYTFRISNQRIINDYNGGKPVQYTVNKTWDFDGENDIYPDIKVVLTQSFQGKDANGQAAEILFNTYEARLTEANGWSYTFGEQEDL